MEKARLCETRARKLCHCVFLENKRKKLFARTSRLFRFKRKLHSFVYTTSSTIFYFLLIFIRYIMNKRCYPFQWNLMLFTFVIAILLLLSFITCHLLGSSRIERKRLTFVGRPVWRRPQPCQPQGRRVLLGTA